MSKKKEYDIAIGETPEELAYAVDDYLDEGWKCQGGIAAVAVAESFSSIKQMYFQAMIR